MFVVFTNWRRMSQVVNCENTLFSNDSGACIRFVGKYLTHRNARITVDGSHGVSGESHSGGNFATVAASSIDWVGGMKKNAGPAFSSNLVRESGFLFAASLILIGIYIAHHTRFIWIWPGSSLWHFILRMGIYYTKYIFFFSSIQTPKNWILKTT